MPLSTHPILRNVLSLSSGELVSKALGFVAAVYLGRVLGSAGFGVIGFAMAVTGYLSLLANPGLDTIGIREIAAHPDDTAKTVSGVLAARALLLLPTGIVLTGLIFLSDLPGNTQTVLVYYGLTLLLLPLTLDFYFIAGERTSAIAVRKTVQAVLYLGGIILFVTGPGDVTSVPLALLAGGAASVLLQPLFMRQGALLSVRGALRQLPPILRASLYVGGSQLLILTYLQIDLVMCGYMLPAQDVGLYTAAQRIIAAVTLLPLVLLQAWMPELSRAVTVEARRAVLRRFLRVMALPGLAIAVAGVLLAPSLLRIMFGNSYLDGGAALRILFVSAGFVFLNMALANPLLAWKRDREYFLIVLGGAILNLVLNAVLIPSSGISGAAAATLAAEALVFVLAAARQWTLHPARSGARAGKKRRKRNSS